MPKETSRRIILEEEEGGDKGKERPETEPEDRIGSEPAGFRDAKKAIEEGYEERVEEKLVKAKAMVEAWEARTGEFEDVKEESELGIFARRRLNKARELVDSSDSSKKAA